LRVRRDQVQLDVALPIALSAWEARPAIVFKDRRGMVMDEFPLVRRLLMSLKHYVFEA